MSPHLNRRSLLATVAGSVALAGCSADSLPLGNRPADPIECAPLEARWPTAGANAGRTRVAPDASFPDAGATLRPSMRRDDPGYGHVDHAPVAADGTTYAAAGSHVVARGTHTWATELDASASFTPTVSCGTVYAHTTVGVTALSPTDGTIRWQVEGRAESPGLGRAMPTALGGTLYLGTEVVVALDERTGERLWVGDFPEDTETVGLAVTDDAVVAAAQFAHDGYGYLACFDSDGSRRWLLRPDDVDYDFAGPAIADGTVYAATDRGRLLAVDLESGVVRWTAPVDRELETGLAVYDDTVFVPAGRAGTFRAVDADTGDERWARAVGQSFFAPAVVGDDLFVPGTEIRAFDAGDDDTRVGFLAVDPRTGDVRQGYPTGVVGPYAVSDGAVYLQGGGNASLWVLA